MESKILDAVLSFEDETGLSVEHIGLENRETISGERSTVAVFASVVL